MRRLVVTLVTMILVFVAAVVVAQQRGNAPPAPPKGSPEWAYGTAPAPAPAPPAGAAAGAAPARGAAPAPDTSLKSIPGSSLQFTLAQIRDGFGPADWFPEDHPAMPEVVAKGKRPDVRACGLCHYPNGKGRAENAGISGLQPAYFMQQMHDFRGDLRKSADARKGNTSIMITIAKGMTEDEIKAAADYFGSMKWTPWIKVTETATVPKTRIAGGLYVALEGNEKEPIGMRIIEVPENGDRTENFRDPHSGFIAYAPVGSLKKGEALVKTGGAGKTTACGICHGADLKGLGPVPPLAGRSPSYIARQLYDIQQGTRKGLWSDLMKPAVAKLTEEDFISIAAYTASLAP